MRARSWLAAFALLLVALPLISCEAQAAPRDVRATVSIVADTAIVTVCWTPPPGNYDGFSVTLAMTGSPIASRAVPRTATCAPPFTVLRPIAAGEACVAATRGTRSGNETCTPVAIQWPEEPIPDVGGVTVEVEVGAVTPPPDTTEPPPVVIGIPQPDPSGYAELPRLWVNTAMTPVSRTVPVSTCAELQPALNAAQDGDRIALAEGLECGSNWVLPPGKHETPVIITTETELPPEGVRVTPETAAKFATLTARTVEPALRTAPNRPVAGWRIMGLHIQPDTTHSVNWALLRIGTGAETTVDSQPSNIIVDRVYISAHDSIDIQRCIAMEGRYIAVVNSWLAGCHYDGADAQAIISWNSIGPHAVRNNHLEGSGENVMWGGSDPKVPGATACDLDVRGNHFVKPAAWADRPGFDSYTEKNLFELKNACRVLIEGNVLEGSWADGQTGFAFVFKSSNDGGRCRHCVTHDVTARDNWIKDSPGGANFVRLDDYKKGQIAANGDTLGGGIPMHNVVYVDNLHTGIMTYQGARRTFQITGAQKLFIARNTMIEKGSTHALMMDGAPSDSTVFRDNLLDRGQYGLFGSDRGEGTNAINYFLPNGIVEGNAIIGGMARLYPSDGGNTFPATVAEAPAGVGVDQVELMRRLEGVVAE